MAQRVHVGVAVAVERQADEVGGEGQRVPSMSISWPCTTWWMTGLGLSGPAILFIGIAIVARPPGPDQTRRRPHHLGRHVVQRPELVVVAPSGPSS